MKQILTSIMFILSFIFTDLQPGVYSLLTTDNQGCSFDTTLTVSTTTSITQPEIVKFFSIHPNPILSDQEITVNLSTAAHARLKTLSISVHAVDGTLYNHHLPELTGTTIQHVIKTKDWPKGVYIVFFLYGNTVLTNEILMIQ